MQSYGAIVYLFKIIDMKSSKGAYICEFLCFFLFQNNIILYIKRKTKRHKK